MPTGPFQSKLDPYYHLIVGLRAASPPTTYARIATILKKEHGLKITRAAIHHFVKVRRHRVPAPSALPLAEDGAVNQKGRVFAKVPAEVLARLDALRGEASPGEASRPSFLPPDGRLTYRRKSE